MGSSVNFKLTEFRIHWDTGTGHTFITLVDLEGPVLIVASSIPGQVTVDYLQ